MRRLPRRLLMSVLVAGTVWWLLPHPADPARAQTAGEPVPSSAGLQWQGVASCAAMACHHMNGLPGTERSEYSTWVAFDPHAKAYLALFNDRSRLIEKNLKKLKDLDDAHPEKNGLCLKCHAMNAAEGERGPKLVLEDGVGCESCHGPAQKWLDQHYQAGWASRTDKEALGFRNTKDLYSRAKICAECHVGAPDRQVNHDLIAAGHPRLNFELGSYLANYPHHWQEKGENARPDFEARVWLIGHLASLDAALLLLETRARSSHKGGDPKAPAGERPVWPEFAEYDCFACHHGLRDEDWRRNRDFSKRAPGSYPWGTWYQALTPTLARQRPGVDSDRVVTSLDELTRLMSRVYPDPGEVARQARQARVPLAAWAQRLHNQPLNPDQVHRLLTALTGDEGQVAGAGWDQSAQLYLGLAALRQARLAQQGLVDRSPAAPPALIRLYEGLKFQPGFDSPTRFQADEFRRALGQLQKTFVD